MPFPSGTRAANRPEPLAPSPVSEACNRAQDLADRASDVAWRLGWLSAEIDHRDPSDKAAIPNQREQLRDLLVDLDDIARDAKRLTTTLDAADRLLQANTRHGTGASTPMMSVPDLGF